MGLHRYVRIDTGQGVFEGLGLWLPKLVDKVLLAVEVGRFNDIEVDQDQSADPASGQCHRYRRAESAEAGDADRSLF